MFDIDNNNSKTKGASKIFNIEYMELGQNTLNIIESVGLRWSY